MLKMYIDSKGSEDDVKRVYISKIMEDDKILVEFNSVDARTDLSCLTDRIGEDIMIYKNHMLQDLYVIESLVRDTENETKLGIEPIYKLGVTVKNKVEFN